MIDSLEYVQRPLLERLADSSKNDPKFFWLITTMVTVGFAMMAYSGYYILMME